MILLVNGLETEQVENFKTLSVWIDYHLTWEYYVPTLLCKFSQNKCAISKT